MQHESTSPNSWTAGNHNARGGFPGIVALTTSLVSHKVQQLIEREDFGPASQRDDTAEDDSLDMELSSISSLLHSLIDAEIRRRSMPKHQSTRRAYASKQYQPPNVSDEPTSAAERPEGGVYDGTTESDAPAAQRNLYSSNGLIGDSNTGPNSGSVKGSWPNPSRYAATKGGPSASVECSATTLSSLTPFILSSAFECPFADIRAVFRSILKRMREELGLAIPDVDSDSSASSWFTKLGNEDEGTLLSCKKMFDSFITRAKYFAENAEVPAPERILFTHWGDLSSGHNATMHKLLYTAEGPLPLVDRLLCALIAAAVHGAEPLTRYIAALLLRGGSFHRRLCCGSPSCNDGPKLGSTCSINGAANSPKKTSDANTTTANSDREAQFPCYCTHCAAADRCGAGKGVREAAIRLLQAPQSEGWPEKYRAIRKVCAILARKPWMLKRSDLDPILSHWSEPELIHMLTIFSYFLGLASLIVVLKVPCDLSTSFEVSPLLAHYHQRASATILKCDPTDSKRKKNESSSDEETRSNDSEDSFDSEAASEAQAVHNASAAAALSPLWTSSEPILSLLVEGGDNTDIVYTKRISKGKGADSSLATSMFSFEDARSLLDTFFPTAADDLSAEIETFGSIVAGESIAQIEFDMKQKDQQKTVDGRGEEDQSLSVLVSDTLKMGPTAKPNLSSTPTANPEAFISGCLPTPPPVPTMMTSPPSQMEIKDVSDSTFWEAVRVYSMNVGGVVDLSYDYCNINNHVGKFAKSFALSATVQPTSDPSEAPYGDPLILPTTYDEEECILALGLQAMYAKIEGLLLRSLSTAK